MGETWFDSIPDSDRAFATEPFRSMLVEDRAKFIGNSHSCYVEEPAGAEPPDGAKPPMSWNLASGLEGKRVLVTGAAGGIGREVALAFGAAGSRVAVVDLAQEKVEAVVGRDGGRPASCRWPPICARWPVTRN